MGNIDTEDGEYKRVAAQIEKNHIFDMNAFMNENPGFDFDTDLDNWKDDVPKEERIHTFPIERNEKEIANIKSRVITCRKWMDLNLFELPQ